jgi:hypothetical protein
MSRGRNWNQVQSRDRMLRQGVDNIHDQSAPHIPTGQPLRPRPSKAELRAQAEAAFVAWSKRKRPK